MNSEDKKRREEESMKRQEEQYKRQGRKMYPSKLKQKGDYSIKMNVSGPTTAKMGGSKKKKGCSSCGEKRKAREEMTRAKQAEAEATSAPSLLKQAGNLTKAVSKHVAGGLKEVSFEVYSDRLATCKDCEFREKNKCLDCGCFILKKAWWKSEDCPQGKWKKQE
jgi:hypothetical protein